MKAAALGWVASIGAHATGGALVLWSLMETSAPGRSLISAPASEPRVVVLLPFDGGPVTEAAEPRPAAPARLAPKNLNEDVAVDLPAAPGGDSGVAAGGSPVRETPPAVVTEPPAPGRIGPRYVSGRLWLGSSARVATGDAAVRHAGSVDSAVRVMLGSFVDSMEAEAALAKKNSHWGTGDLGIDAKWITIAGVKVPTPLLVLLPVTLPAPSIDQVQKAQRLAAMREDIYRAAATAHDYEDFKKTLRDIRHRVEEEREFERNRRAPMHALPADTTQ